MWGKMRHDLQGFDCDAVPLDHIIGTRNARLLKTITYTDKDGVKYRAHKGMMTDGGSVPAFFWRSVSPPYASKALPAFCIHDKICNDARHLADSDYESAKKLRKEGDDLFLEMMHYLKVPRWKARIMHAGVRIGALNLRNNKRAS
jgi:hypothetical protein